MSETYKNMQIQRCKNMECTEPKLLKSDWREEVKFHEHLDSYKDEFFDMVSEFEDMSDRHLCWIDSVTHRIYRISPFTQLIHSAHYYTGPRVREFEWNEIEEMRKMKYIRPIQMEWAALIIFATEEG